MIGHITKCIHPDAGCMHSLCNLPPEYNKYIFRGNPVCTYQIMQSHSHSLSQRFVFATRQRNSSASGTQNDVEL